MAGIYIHIPFCRKACHYCDFHFSTSTALVEPMAHAIVRELELRAGALHGEEVHTLYFGGGTPSLMPLPLLQMMLDAVRRHCHTAAHMECTLEANPDDLNTEFLQALKSMGFNRLSIGIQSFDDEMLRWMNRAHTAAEAAHSVEAARAAGFNNLSIDLIYGLPGLSTAQWRDAVERGAGMGVQHVSSYCLTVEDKTALGHRVRKGLEKPVDEEAAATQFVTMVEVLAAYGFEHYEVSNFARAGFRSRHNTSYWQGIPYLGLGPSAHSYLGATRAWNVANNAAYIKAIKNGELPLTTESLSPADQYNEWIMTGLRTSYGVALSEARTLHGVDLEAAHGTHLRNILSQGWATLSADRLCLTTSGMFMADGIAAEFFTLEAP